MASVITNSLKNKIESFDRLKNRGRSFFSLTQAFLSLSVATSLQRSSKCSKKQRYVFTILPSAELFV